MEVCFQNAGICYALLKGQFSGALLLLLIFSHLIFLLIFCLMLVFYDDYAQWITVYKEGAIRKAAMDK